MLCLTGNNVQDGDVTLRTNNIVVVYVAVITKKSLESKDDFCPFISSLSYHSPSDSDLNVIC